MADTVKTTWLYPSNWDGSYAGEGEVDPPIQKLGWKRMKVQFSNFSDGTGETGVRKLVRGDMFGVQGLACNKIGIERISYSLYGMSVTIEYDMTPDQLIAELPLGQEGVIEGPFYPIIDGAYDDGETGDVLFTTVGHTANDSYNIILDILIKE